MQALTWQGREKVEITDVPDPKIEQPTDAIKVVFEPHGPNAASGNG